MRTRSVAVWLLATITPTVLPSTALAQVVSGHPLQGEWVRTTSTNNPNDSMRIDIAAGKAALTFVPAGASFFRAGQVLWQSIQSSGALEVLGGDGGYHPATITMNGPDEIQLVIHHSSTVGTRQTWHRAGPDISGDWERVATSGSPWDGTQVQVQGIDASVRYLPPRAPRHVRVGRDLWRGVGASGGLRVLGSDGQYHPATWTLQTPDRIVVDASAIAGGPGQVWVRPALATAARAGLSGPPGNPNAPGSGLTPPSGRPGLPGPATTTTPVANACLATSRPHDAMATHWALSFSKWGGRNRSLEETAGLTPFLAAAAPLAADDGGNVPVDIEQVLLPDGTTGWGYLTNWRDQGVGNDWRRTAGHTAQELDLEIQAARAAGERPADVEGYLVGPPGRVLHYAAVWEADPDGLDWKLEYDLTGQEYGAAFRQYRNGGYRLIDMERYETSSGALRYAAIWWASCDDANWKQVRDMDRAGYDARVNAEAALGFNVIDFESYLTPSGQRYAAIFERTTPGRDWAVRSDRDFTWFLNYHREYSDRGMRLIDFESYETGGGVRYAGVWAENDPRYDFPFRPALETAVANYRTLHDVPGISVVAYWNGRVIYRGGFGWADSLAAKRAWSGTLYPTASIAKVVAGTLAGRFEDQGLIDLTDATSDHLDYIDGTVHTHTVEDLLAKLGCIRAYDGTTPAQTQVYAYRRDAVEQMMGDGQIPGCTPGVDYRYSTHGYTYVGAVLEEVLGRTIYDILHEELVLPFGLFDLEPMAWESFGQGPYAGQGTRPYELAQGYWWTNGSSDPRDYENMSWKVLGGGMQSSARDLARFGQLTLAGDIAPTDRLWAALATGATADLGTGNPLAPMDSVGLAWNLRTRNGGRPTAEHSGDTFPGWGGGGPTLRLYTAPADSGLVIAVMNNQQNTSQVLNPAAMPPSNPGDDGQPVERLASAIATAIYANPPP